MIDTKALFKIGEITEEMTLICKEFQKIGGIYMLFFPNGQYYIGSTHRLKNRMRQHKRNLQCGRGVLPKALWEQYKHADIYLIEPLPINIDLNKRLIFEQRYISLLKPQLNRHAPKPKNNVFAYNYFSHYEKEPPKNDFELQKQMLIGLHHEEMFYKKRIKEMSI